MIYLIHGDDSVSSRKFLTDLTDGYQVTNLDGKSLLIKDLEEKVLSTSLFDDKKAVVVEGLLSKNAKKKDFVTYLNNLETQTLLVLWEDKKLLKTSFSGLKTVTVRDFLLPQNYFQFLDSFTQRNGKRLFLMYHDLLKTMTAEQIFYSLLKRLRLLVVLESNSKTTDLEKMAPWQVGKLQSQLRNWSKDGLISFYKSLQEAEIRLKTGKLPTGLSKHLDTLILSELT